MKTISLKICTNDGCFYFVYSPGLNKSIFIEQSAVKMSGISEYKNLNFNLQFLHHF